MKEELKNIKTNVEEIAITKKEFDKKRRLFNLKVEEALEESGIKEFAEETLSDSYSRACVFAEYARSLINLLKILGKNIQNMVKLELGILQRANI